MTKGLVCVGWALADQFRPGPTVKLQPSVVSDRGRVSAGLGGYIWAPTPTHRDTANPDNRPSSAP